MTGGLIFLFTVHLSANSLPAADRWFAPDKAKHFAMGAFTQGLGFGVARASGLSRSASLIPATVASVGAGIWKERHDRNGHGTVSRKDLSWTVLGAAAITPLLAQTPR